MFRFMADSRGPASGPLTRGWQPSDALQHWQPKLSQDEFRDLIRCRIARTEYVELLRQKRVI
jgi:hypothetical protein